jgi:hypothetical protein
MRLVGIGVLLAILLGFPSPAPAQEAPPRTWAPVYGATGLVEGLGVHRPHVGGRLAVALTDRIDLYPGLELGPDRSFSTALFDVRVKPIASYGATSAWYVGGGIAVAERYSVRVLRRGP